MQRFKVKTLQKLLIHINFLLAFSVLFCSHSAFGQSVEFSANVDSKAIDLGPGFLVYWAASNFKDKNGNEFIYGYDFDASTIYEKYWRVPTKAEIEYLINNTTKLYSNNIATFATNTNQITVSSMNYHMGGSGGESSWSTGWMFWSCTNNYIKIGHLFPIITIDKTSYYVLRYNNGIKIDSLNRANGLPLRLVIDKKYVTVNIYEKIGAKSVLLETITKAYPQGTKYFSMEAITDDCHTFDAWYTNGKKLNLINPGILEIQNNYSYDVYFIRKTTNVKATTEDNRKGTVGILEPINN